jgi:hypothetical protein
MNADVAVIAIHVGEVRDDAPAESPDLLGILSLNRSRK